jgi:dynein heavy chain
MLLCLSATHSTPAPSQQVSKALPSWRTYVDYVSNIVVDGFANAIVCTLRHLLASIDPAQLAAVEGPPLLEIQLELVAPDIIWRPELTEGTGDVGVRDMVQRWLKSFMEVGGLVKRLDTGEGSYAKELEEDYNVLHMVDQVMNITLGNEVRCEEFKQQYGKFEYLWKQDLHKALQDFLAADGVALPDGTKDDPPLAKFEEQIQKYK